MDDFALAPAERRLLAALNARGARFIVIGLGAAVLQGAPLSTQDSRFSGWNIPVTTRSDKRPQTAGVWISPFGMQPPAFGGDGLERIDVHGLEDFAAEYQRAFAAEIDQIPLKVLPLERVIAEQDVNEPAQRSGRPAGTQSRGAARDAKASD